jgi:hypothetical protein
MPTAAALNVNHNASVLCRNVKRVTVWGPPMVGGPLFRTVTLAARLALPVLGARILDMGPSLQPLPSLAPIGLGQLGQWFNWTPGPGLGLAC